MVTMSEITVSNVKGVTCRDKPKEDYHPNLQFSALQLAANSQMFLFSAVGGEQNRAER